MSLYKSFRSFIWKASFGCNAIGVFTFFAMAFLIVINIIMRQFSTGIVGTYEIVQLMMAIGIFLSLAHTELKSGHVNIDLLTSKMPKSFQKVLAMALLLLSVCTFALVLFCTTMKAQHDIASNNLTWILKIPYFPVTCVAIVGCFLMCAALLINLIDLFLEKEEEKAEISD